MRKTAMHKRRSLFFTIMADLLFNLLAFYMLMVGVKTEEVKTSQVVASRVPGLEEHVMGLQGQLEDAKKDLTFANEQGDKFRSLLKGKEMKIGHLKDQYQLLSSAKGGLEKQLGLMASELGGMKITVGQQKKKISEYENRFRAGVPVTIVVVIDVTASMQPAIDELLMALSTLLETVPTTSIDFRVGIVAFRKGVVAEFPISKVLAHYEDEGKSQKAVLNFVDSLRASNSMTRHLPAFRRAGELFKQAHAKHDPKRKETLIFIGDVGCSEIDERPGYSFEERKVMGQILSAMKQWVRQKNRAVASLYVESEHTRKDPSARESRQWFESLGSLSPTSAFYTDTNELLRAMQKATRK